MPYLFFSLLFVLQFSTIHWLINSLWQDVSLVLVLIQTLILVRILTLLVEKMINHMIRDKWTIAAKMMLSPSELRVSCCCTIYAVGSAALLSVVPRHVRVCLFGILMDNENKCWMVSRSQEERARADLFSWTKHSNISGRINQVTLRSKVLGLAPTWTFRDVTGPFASNCKSGS